MFLLIPSVPFPPLVTHAPAAPRPSGRTPTQALELLRRWKCVWKICDVPSTARPSEAIKGGGSGLLGRAVLRPAREGGLPGDHGQGDAEVVGQGNAGGRNVCSRGSEAWYDRVVWKGNIGRGKAGNGGRITCRDKMVKYR